MTASGYRESSPVLRGNRAYKQRQIGSLGYLADAAWTMVDRGGQWPPRYAELMRRVASYTCDVWQDDDSGIWELAEHAQYVASKVMCWVVLDRAIKIGQRTGAAHAAEIARWQSFARTIHADVLARGYSEPLGAFRQRYGHESLDAAMLLAPVMGFLPPSDPRVRNTVDRIEQSLTLDGYVYRFAPMDTPAQGKLPITQFEGAFLPCTFWLAAARAMDGRIDAAERLLSHAEGLAGELGLFAEEVDARDGTMLGNYPLVFSHVEHLRAVVVLDEAIRRSSHSNSR